MTYERLYHDLKFGMCTLNFGGRSHFYFIFLFFNKIIIPLALAGYEITIPNSALGASWLSQLISKAADCEHSCAPFRNSKTRCFIDFPHFSRPCDAYFLNKRSNKVFILVTILNQ